MRAFVVFCHPRRDSFTGAELDRAIAGLVAGGHEYRLTDLYADGFVPELDAASLSVQHVDHRGHPELRPGVDEYVHHLQWCDTLVLVHPTWWSAQPAMLTGFFDRVLVKGVAYDVRDGRDRVRAKLTNIRRLVVVTSHGSPKRVNMIQGESGKRIVGRTIRALCARRCRVDWIALYDIDHADDAARRAHLDRVEERLRGL